MILTTYSPGNTNRVCTREQLCVLQVMRKNDLIRKNMVESVRNERNILAMANNPFVVRPLIL